MSAKEYGILLVVVVVGVLLAGFVGKKMGLSSYDEYESLEEAA